MKNKKLLFFSALFLFLGFLFFLILVSINLFNRIDLLVTQELQKIIPRYLDVPFSLFSLIGSLEIVSIVLLMVWAKDKKLNYFYVLISFGLFHVVEILGKLFVNHPNPPFQFFRYSIPFSFPTAEVNTGSSFPSGHMGRTAFLSALFIFMIYNSKAFSKLQKKLLYCLIVIIVGLMFLSRIYLGEHWFSDVLGGSILGASFGLLSLGFLF